MRRLLTLLAVSCAVKFTVVLVGCGGGSGVSGDKLSAAGKPPPGGAAYTAVELPPVSGTTSYATDVNSGGQVVGHWIDGSNVRHAFQWSQGSGLVGLSGLSGQSYALGLNDAGAIVGGAAFAAGSHAFLWQSGSVTDLGTLSDSSSPRSSGTAINSAGQVAGYCYDDNNQHNQAFLWTASGGMTYLGALGGAEARGQRINDGGQVCGWATNASGTHRAFLWNAGGGMQDLGALPGGLGGSQGYGLNASGQVVGSSDSTKGLAAFLWNGAMSALPTLSGATGAIAMDINDSSVVVGVWADKVSAYHACIWRNGVASDLNKLIPSGSGWDLTYANAINSNGWIVGYGVKNRQTHGFVLIPN